MTFAGPGMRKQTNKQTNNYSAGLCGALLYRLSYNLSTNMNNADVKSLPLLSKVPPS